MGTQFWARNLFEIGTVKWDRRSVWKFCTLSINCFRIWTYGMASLLLLLFILDWIRVSRVWYVSILRIWPCCHAGKVNNITVDKCTKTAVVFSVRKQARCLTLLNAYAPSRCWVVDCCFTTASCSCIGVVKTISSLLVAGCGCSIWSGQLYKCGGAVPGEQICGFLTGHLFSLR